MSLPMNHLLVLVSRLDQKICNQLVLAYYEHWDQGISQLNEDNEWEHDDGDISKEVVTH